uniref:Uncharacterized protein n=1 Tax=Heliothis virescens TaxID=7102 RepID=A0A2A4K0M9_HELVI
MTSIADIAETQRIAMLSLNQRMAEFEAHLKGSPAGADLSGLQKDFGNFKEHVWGVLSALQEQIANMGKCVDVMEMRHRKKFLLLGGVPELPDEKLPECVSSILQSKLGITGLTPSSINTCHRLGTSSNGHARPIILRFDDLRVRGEIWRSKSKLKGSTYVLSEFLTRQRQSAFTLARKLFGVPNVWTMDGNINIKLPDGKRRRIFCSEEVTALATEYGKSLEQEGLAGSKSGSVNTSPAPAQTSTRSRRNIKKK